MAHPRKCSRCGHYVGRRHMCPAVREARELLRNQESRREVVWLERLVNVGVVQASMSWKLLGTINRVTVARS